MEFPRANDIAVCDFLLGLEGRSRNRVFLVWVRYLVERGTPRPGLELLLDAERGQLSAISAHQVTQRQSVLPLF